MVGEDSQRFVVSGADVLTILKRGSGSRSKSRKRAAGTAKNEESSQDAQSPSNPENNQSDKDELTADE